MSDRVLSSGAAREAITKMQTLIDSGLGEQIRALNVQGQLLSDKTIWDGMEAEKFRGDWEQMRTHLDNAQRALTELRARIGVINQNIMSAGGNQ